MLMVVVPTDTPMDTQDEVVIYDTGGGGEECNKCDSNYPSAPY